MNEKRKNPARRRCFLPAPDVAVLLGLWAAENPDVIEARMLNAALRAHLAAYGRKRQAAEVAA